jgi:uncharacterized protein (TIGR04562 family)
VDAPYFPLDTLRSIIGGTSGLDVPRLHLRTEAEAEAFLDSYGFTWSVPEHRVEVEGVRQEALAFLEQVLLDPDERIPSAVRDLTDARILLCLASDRRDPLQPWACALLRVMHTVAHCSSLLEERYGPAIRAQILARFEPHLLPDSRHPTSLGGEVPLVAFEVKAAKSRQSTVLKLLHKAENVAADIFDRVGVRIITETRFDALLAVRFLRVNNVIVFANVKPTRSRNTLVDLDAIADELVTLDREGVAALRTRPLPAPPEVSPASNPFSSRTYRSIQFTCRQLIRTDTVRFFFPFEVQILDRASWQASQDGMASHDEYRARQRRAVRRRVLGELAG